MNIDYTFIVTCYNEERFVVETLESIKYQILRYGNNYSCQLIVADDGSKDRTQIVVKKWVASNEKLFEKIDLLFSVDNKGTCSNYTNALKHISGRFYREIAGDDILPINNVFEVMDETDKHDMVLGISLKFSNGEFFTDYRCYKSIIRQGLYGDEKIKNFSGVICPIQNGFLLSLRLIDEALLDFINLFVLVEDRPLYYYLFHKRKVDVFFLSKTLLLSRSYQSSVSHLTNSKVIKDELLLHKINAENTLSSFYRYVSNYYIKKNKYPFIFKLWIKLYHAFLDFDVRRIYKKVVLPAIAENKDYLDLIKNAGEVFWTKIDV